MNQKKYIAIFGLVTILLISGFNVAYAAPRQSVQLKLNQYKPVSASPNPVIEGESFTVTVRDENGDPVYGAGVIFYKTPPKLKTTNKDGKCSFDAPYLNDDKSYTVESPGFGSTVIKVRAKKLFISDITVEENEQFYGYVTDQDGNPAVAVSVIFNGELKLTDFNGKTISPFVSPSVTENTDFDIIATAPLRGYTQGDATVHVIDVGNPLPIHFHGVITYMGDSSLIEGAIVSSSTNEQSQPTGEDGVYDFWVHIPDVGEDVTLTASCSGYKSASETFKDLQGGEDIVYNFALQEENSNQ